MAQQTAVEWLELVYYSQQGFLSKKDIEQAKEMEKEQIINACESHADYPFEHKDFEEYYNETYTNGL
jgi:hypothetical protein